MIGSILVALCMLVAVTAESTCPSGGATVCPGTSRPPLMLLLPSCQCYISAVSHVYAATTTCCKMNPPDPARVPGGYGCMPSGQCLHLTSPACLMSCIGTAGWPGCAGGGTYPTGCCCAPGNKYWYSLCTNQRSLHGRTK